ncbi:MAG: 2-C-methyl-D-erythritol 4-phosphate cytidylyltransferase, partial [Thermomicrobiales bacterium]
MKRIAAAIIVAAGRGERFGAPDKVFSDLAGKPMVAWSLDAFNSAQSIGEIILVAGEHTLALAQKLQGSDTWPKLRKVVVGGDRRQDSVLLGMQQVGSECSIVAIHDGARPLIETEAIDRCIA